jgi:hypothetical protein
MIIKDNGKSYDEAKLLAALHNGTQCQGMGVLHDLGRDMTAEEAQKELDEARARQGTLRSEIYFDYFHGRPLKVGFEQNGNGLPDFRLYDRDAGKGAGARAAEQALIDE